MFMNPEVSKDGVERWRTTFEEHWVIRGTRINGGSVHGVGGNFDRIFQLKIWRGGKVMEKGCNFDETFNVSIERFL